MTTKDYKLIAEVLREAATKDIDPDTDWLTVEGTRWAIAKEFADRLEADNPRFNRAKFLDEALWGTRGGATNE